MRATAVAAAKCSMVYWILLHLLVFATLVAYPNDASNSLATGRLSWAVCFPLLSLLTALVYWRLCFSDPGWVLRPGPQSLTAVCRYITETEPEEPAQLHDERWAEPHPAGVPVPQPLLTTVAETTQFAASSDSDAVQLLSRHPVDLEAGANHSCKICKLNQPLRCSPSPVYLCI